MIVLYKNFHFENIIIFDNNESDVEEKIRYGIDAYFIDTGNFLTKTHFKNIT